MKDGKQVKYLDLVSEPKKLLNIKETVIPVPILENDT